jgi:hypothetical protein
MVSHEKGSDLYARYATDCNPQSYVAYSTQGNAGRMEGSHLSGRHPHHHHRRLTLSHCRRNARHGRPRTAYKHIYNCLGAKTSALLYHFSFIITVVVSLTGTGKIRPVLDRLAVGLLLIQKRTCPLGRRVLLPSESHLPTPTTLLAFAAALDHQPHCLQPAASSTVACVSQEVVELPLPIRLSSILSYLSGRIFWCLNNRYHRRQGFPAKR